MVSTSEKNTIREGIRYAALDFDERHPGWADKIDYKIVTTLYDREDKDCPGTGCIAFAFEKAGMFADICRAHDAAIKRLTKFFFFLPRYRSEDSFYVECWHAEILSRRTPVLLAKVVERCVEPASYALAK